MTCNKQLLTTAENRYTLLELVENWQSDFGHSHGMAKRKTPKGEVAVTTDRSRLLLHWSYQGERYTLYVGMPDSLANRKAAELKAKLIERDMTAEAFDRTLSKYRPEQAIEAIGVVELFERFTAHKTKTPHSQSLTKYAGTLSYASWKRGITTACTRPPTRRLLCSAKGTGRRVMLGVSWLPF